MILTVTPNPALDYTIRVDAIVVGKRAKYREPSVDPSGKGINVSRMIRRLGEPTLALGFAGGATGEILRQGLDREGVPHDLVPFSGLTRVNVTILSGTEGSATHFHGPGDAVAEADLQQLLKRASSHLYHARVLVLSGSLPPGIAPSSVAELIRIAGLRGVRSIIDAEGEMLAAAIAAGADLVKPNILEASQFLGRPLSGVDEAVAAAREIAARGVKTVVVTLRGDGAVGVNGPRAWHVRPPREDVVRAIGAGDSFAAGLAVALSRGAELPEALRWAAAAGAATARHTGTSRGTAEEADALRSSVDLRELA
ncbi:MAG TPA: 1-phosphofructokinase family hexose kinase [Planctomycetota bacterium]|nr:1-phosphofructokinase family hexose kinase [Planctomycetota bacterium]